MNMSENNDYYIRKVNTCSAQFEIIQNHVKPDYPNESENHEKKYPNANAKKIIKTKPRIHKEHIC